MTASEVSYPSAASAAEAIPAKLSVSSADVAAEPFPHVAKDGILPPDVFEALRNDFPGAEVFQDQVATYGARGSRTGTGFDISRGDASYGALTARSAAWRAFDAYINSNGFADTFRDVFKAHLDDVGLRIDVRRSEVDTNYVESRDTMAEGGGFLTQPLFLAANRFFARRQTPKPRSLFTRLDIHRSFGGYAKPPHCDHPNRLCSLIIYFTDADAAGLQGGDLLIFAHKQRKSAPDYERHPRIGDVTEVARLRPKANRGVFFPCSNNSYHGVTKVISEDIPRDFLYINISAKGHGLW